LEYFEIINKKIRKLIENRQKIETKVERNKEIKNWKLITISNPVEVMKVIFSKLNKAKSIIEDELNRNEGNKKDPESIISLYFD
jgi:hypothetical protein